MANPSTSMALIPWSNRIVALRSDRQLAVFDMNLGPGRLLHQAYSASGRWVEKGLGLAGHKLGMGPFAVSLRIKKAFGDDPLTRQSKLDNIYDSFQEGTNTQRDRALNKECQILLEYALPSQSPVTQAETFKQIITLTTRYPGLGRLFLQCPDINRVAYSPDAICEFWRNEDHNYDKESNFLLNFAANCLARIEPNIELEGIRPSELGCTSEKVPGVIERWLARHSDSDGGSRFARLIAIRYIATILELPAFWSENYQIQKITMDILCKQTLLFIEDINPESVSADDFEVAKFDPDGIDALADAILVGAKHWLQRQPELTESGPPYWLASLVKLIKNIRGLILPSYMPMAFRRAADDWEALLRVVEHKLSMESSLDQFEDVYAFVKKCSGILPSLMKSSDVVPNFDAKGFSPLKEASKTHVDYNPDEFKTDSSESPSAASLSDSTAREVPEASSTPNTSSHPIGAEILLQGVDPITADIVFVHGLRGHRTDTWTKDNVCWPQDLLSKEEALLHIRVITLGYDANIVNLDGHASLNTLFQHSINLVQELSRLRRKDARDRPIIFVAHSLGGLIVKDVLHYSNQVQDTHPHLAQIFNVTRGIIFLGTPHRGNGVTSIAKVVASVAWIALQNPHTNLIRDLERDSQTLDRIGDSFSRILDMRKLTIWSFSEELAMTGIGKIVPGDSAIIGDPREYRGTIHGDHISMVKFLTRDDPGYKKVLYSIEMLLEQLEEESSKQSVDKTSYTVPPLRAGKEKALGSDHTSTLDTVNNLGHLYAGQGRLKDAEMMYDRALAGYEKAWGPGHTSTLKTVNNVGSLYHKQGRLKDAEMMYDRALAGYEKALGREHTSTFDTVSNLGLLYTDLGRLKDAEIMYNRALAGYEKALGPEHPSTHDTVNNLGLLYEKQGRLKDAEIMYHRALAGKEKA